MSTTDAPHFVYRCYDADGRLIYIGCTNNPAVRLAAHRKTWWGYQIAAVRNLVFSDRTTALAAERKAIAEERPRWNVQGRWAGRSLWAVEDYADYFAAVTAGEVTSATAAHLERVRIEAKRRYNIDLQERAA